MTRTAADTEAAKRVLLHVMSYLELLTADVADLMTALDKGPGEASALAARLLDDPDDLWRYNPCLRGRVRRAACARRLAVEQLAGLDVDQAPGVEQRAGLVVAADRGGPPSTRWPGSWWPGVRRRAAGRARGGRPVDRWPGS
jgi:hypothetical protein